MTLALDRPMSQVDSTLAKNIRSLIDNLDEKTYDIVRDSQEIFGSEVILVDNSQYHWEIEINKFDDIKLLYQKYLPNGGLHNISFTSITSLSQLTKLIQA